MNKFSVENTAYDPKGKPVHLCKNADGFYVYKPSSGFQSRSFATADDEALVAIYERQRSCMHTHASYLPGEREVKEAKAPKQVTPVGVPLKELLASIASAPNKEALEALVNGDRRKKVLEAVSVKLAELESANG